MNPTSLRSLLVALACALPTASALADDPVNGAALYVTHCASCHGNAPLTSNSKKIYNGRNARGVTDSAITNVGEMNSLRAAFPTAGVALADVAAYLGNTPTTVAFPATAVGATSAPVNVTVYASLKAGNALAGLAVTVTGSFSRSGGTCGTSLAVGSSCTIALAFAPTQAGAQSGRLSVTHSKTLAPISIALSGTATGGAAPAPLAMLAPATLAFADTAVGATSGAQNITVSNTGNAALALASLVYSPADFITAGGSCAVPGSLAPGASCTLAVAFRPTAGAAGARSGSLSLAHNAAASPSVASLAGNALVAAAPVASLSPALAFGSINVGSSSPAQTATLSNTGTAPLVPSAITTGSAEFVPNGGSCAVGVAVAPGGSCSIGLVFSPAAAGARSASLSVAHNAAGGSSTAALSGTGQALTPGFSASPSSLVFSQTVNTSSAVQAVTLSNPGTGALTLGSLALVGAQAGEFQIATGSTCTSGTVLPANGSCSLRLAFVPAATGLRAAALSIAHNASGSPGSIALNGTGTSAPQPAISLAASSLSLGSQVLGTPGAVQTVAISNSGAAPLVLGTMALAGTAAGDFVRSGSCTTGTSLAAGASCGLAFSFVPTATGARTATLTIASNASNGAALLSLAGTGLAVPVPLATASPAALDFGSQAVATTSAARTVTLANTGTATLALSSLTATPGFLLTHDCGSALALGGSCSLSVQFAPGQPGPTVGTLGIASNAAGSPLAVSLAGTGVAAAPVLAWSPAATSLAFGSAEVGAAAVQRTLTLANQGPGPAVLQQLVLAGLQAADYSLGSASTCAVNLSLPAGSRCDLVLQFSPAAAGPRAATLQVLSNGGNPAELALTGIGSAAAQPAVVATPAALAFNVTDGNTADAQDLSLHNSGNAVLHVTALGVSAGRFTLAPATVQGCQAPPFDLLPGQACRVTVGWSGSVAGSEVGALEVTSNATAAVMSVPLSASRAVAVPQPAAEATGPTNQGAGGCSMAGGNGDVLDPSLWLLVVLAMAVLWRRRRAPR